LDRTVFTIAPDLLVVLVDDIDVEPAAREIIDVSLFETVNKPEELGRVVVVVDVNELEVTELPSIDDTELEETDTILVIGFIVVVDVEELEVRIVLGVEVVGGVKVLEVALGMLVL